MESFFACLFLFSHSLVVFIPAWLYFVRLGILNSPGYEMKTTDHKYLSERTKCTLLGRRYEPVAAEKEATAAPVYALLLGLA